MKSRFKTSLFFCIVLLASILIGCQQAPHNIGPQDSSFGNTIFGYPVYYRNQSTEEAFMIERRCYSLSYNNKTYNPNWVAWHLSHSDYETGHRKDAFESDNILPDTWYRPDELSFKGTGFDRGHMCPSGDRTSSKQMNKETFYMTNMVPQCNANNSGAWESFETYIRKEHVSKGQEAYIICGPYGTGGVSRYGKHTSYIEKYLSNEKGGSSLERINVPAYTWKIVIILDEGENDSERVNKDTEVFAVWMPNNDTCEWYPFNPHLVSIDFIEKKTGYDFFAELPDEIENHLESHVHPAVDYEVIKDWEK